MMMRRIAGMVAATLLGLAPATAFALSSEASTQIVPAARLAALAERTARSLVPDPQRALAATFTLADQIVPSGTVSVVAGQTQSNTSYVSVPLAIAVDGRVVRTVYAGFRITSYVRMPVATHDLAAGSIVAVDDLAYINVPFNGRPALEIASFVGRKVRGLVARGAILYPELTSVNEIVRAGMPAVLIVRDGSVMLAADGVARSSGGLGDYVTIFNPQTQRVLSGIVTGPNTVELTLPGSEN
jgi:flagella basal body P-ring formation protein FlgA